MARQGRWESKRGRGNDFGREREGGGGEGGERKGAEERRMREGKEEGIRGKERMRWEEGFEHPPV